MMTRQTRLGFLLAALLLIPVYFTPVWTITLKAPQYPDGMGMYIWVDDITGHSRHDLQNINILNHYIGMKEIHPEDFAELEIIPWVVAGLIALGCIVALAGYRWLAWTWVTIFIIAGIAGMIDFYLWSYDYGHNLDPRAAIKVPGMTYQPPILGSKTLLNITATSWPYWGSLWIGLSLLTGAAMAWQDQRLVKKPDQ
jgi:copper chaperone NosL